MRITASLLVPVAVALLGLSACGDDEEPNEESRSGATEMVIDPNAPLRPIVKGTYEFRGPEGSFTQPLIGKLLGNESCASYGQKGDGSRFSTPYALYPTGTKLDHSLSASVAISPYDGPGTYTSKANQISGSLGARDGSGAPIGAASATYDSSFTFTTTAEGGGTVEFEGQNRDSPSSEQRVSGSLTWTCEDTRLRQSGYSLNAYP